MRIVYWLHALLIPMGLFFLVGGTYGVVLQIKDAYASGLIGELNRPFVIKMWLSDCSSTF